MTREEAIAELRGICREIGCSGLGPECIEKPHLCSIIRKIFLKGEIWTTTHDAILTKRNDEDLSV